MGPASLGVVTSLRVGEVTRYTPHPEDLPVDPAGAHLVFKECHLGQGHQRVIRANDHQHRGAHILAVIADRGEVAMHTNRTLEVRLGTGQLQHGGTTCAVPHRSQPCRIHLGNFFHGGQPRCGALAHQGATIAGQFQPFCRVGCIDGGDPFAIQVNGKDRIALSSPLGSFLFGQWAGRPLFVSQQHAGAFGRAIGFADQGTLQVGVTILVGNGLVDRRGRHQVGCHGTDGQGTQYPAQPGANEGRHDQNLTI